MAEQDKDIAEVKLIKSIINIATSEIVASTRNYYRNCAPLVNEIKNYLTSS